MNITRNGQNISFIVENGDLMQIGPYVSKAGDPYREMKAYRIGDIIVEAQERGLAMQAAREWNAKIDNYSHADDEYAILKPTDETTTDAAPVAVADPAEVLAGKVSELLSVIGSMQFGQGDDGIVAQTLTALADYRTATRAAERAADPAEIVGYVVKFSVSDNGDVVSMDYVRHADAAAYFWHLVAAHQSDGSSVPVSTHPLALRREGVETLRGRSQRWMVSLDVVMV